mmetsp:Transcript_44139/g.146250  ORF Transcript_44139/g.146250 Transcript_44139/m.146250 type:complete len:203 (-) Transcript_44139:30-638(-)
MPAAAPSGTSKRTYWMPSPRDGPPGSGLSSRGSRSSFGPNQVSAPAHSTARRRLPTGQVMRRLPSAPTACVALASSSRRCSAASSSVVYASPTSPRTTCTESSGSPTGKWNCWRPKFAQWRPCIGPPAACTCEQTTAPRGSSAPPITLNQKRESCSVHVPPALMLTCSSEMSGSYRTGRCGIVVVEEEGAAAADATRNSNMG